MEIPFSVIGSGFEEVKQNLQKSDEEFKVVLAGVSGGGSFTSFSDFQNMFPFGNLDSNTFRSTNPGLRNSIEIGVLYKLNALHKGQEIKKHTRGKQR